MGAKINFELQIFLLVILSGLFTFLGINFNPDLGFIYLGMTLGALAAVMLAFVKPGNNDGFPIIIKGRKMSEALMWGAGAFVIFFFAVQLIIPQFFPVQETTGQLIKEFVQATALEESQLVRLIAFGFLIPIIETLLLFGVVMYLYGIFAKVNIYDKNLFTQGALLLMIVTVSIFTLFHLTAKGVTNTRDLSISAIFALTTVALILHRQQQIEAMIMHITNNVNAVLN